MGKLHNLDLIQRKQWFFATYSTENDSYEIILSIVHNIINQEERFLEGFIATDDIKPEDPIWKEIQATIEQVKL